MLEYWKANDKLTEYFTWLWLFLIVLVVVSLIGGLVYFVSFFLASIFPNSAVNSSPSPEVLKIAERVALTSPDSNNFNCWDYSNKLVKELNKAGFKAFVKRGLYCNSYCWRTDFNVDYCCERHAWVAVESENGLIEIEATTGRIIWK